jgi:hypothetical protein
VFPGSRGNGRSRLSAIMQDYFVANRELADSQIGGPLRPVAAGIVIEAEPLAAFERIAAELLHLDRGAGTATLGDKGARPFEMKGPGSRP